ncbi:apoptosis regulatory protein Siva isoform X1 [Phyllopteryx taeniolatus]|uniref:apoptosis regulatory protein Siva isoform X1 n=1 Tax=Phyllopteryx taeniolatus TaxID=161469 RepID=UPI002AD388CF|nr:apoptosis regulatory protein Siva isoform X1 [Phyllopteryx taeniolatus]
MPKRAYPFTETFSSQYKIHVGQHELNNSSVLGNKYRKEIYEKTKNLLFNGAKAVVDKIWSADEKTNDPQPTGQETAESSQTLLRGQTLIGTDGRLTKATRTQGPPPTGCCVCQKSTLCRTSCSQCERLACSSCSRQCSNCSNICCSVCTVIDYSGRYDEVLCCSCST